MVPVARLGMSRSFSIVLRGSEVSFCKTVSLLRSAAKEDPQPLRTDELCNKGFKLNRDWVVWSCSSAN